MSAVCAEDVSGDSVVSMCALTATVSSRSWMSSTSAHQPKQHAKAERNNTVARHPFLVAHPVHMHLCHETICNASNVLRRKPKRLQGKLL